MVFEEYGWAIYVLVYLSGTSGSIVKNERDIIISFIKDCVPYEDITFEWLDKTIKKLYRPGKMEIRKWIKSDIANGQNYETLFPWFEKLAEYQKEPNSEFFNIIKYVKKQIKLFNEKSKV
jgi:hypothetical protein